MKLFFRYLKYKLKYILIFFLFVCFFSISFALYHLPLAAVIYPTLICAVFGFIAFIFDFCLTIKRHKEFSRLFNTSIFYASSLPSPDGIYSDDCLKLIEKLQNEMSASEEELNAKYSNMINYYTTWAHQIKTPLSSMRLTVGSEDSELCRRLSNDLVRTEQYVDMVMVYLRLDSPSSDYVLCSCDIDSVIVPSVRNFAGEFIYRKIKLEYTQVNINAVSDEKWLSFVIEQILSNALKYTKSGSIKIYSPSENLLCIQDTGIGIAPEDLPRVFENGYTGQNGRSDKKASGIGLYLCKKICDNLGHKITVESELGNGCKVTLDFSQYRMNKFGLND